MENEEQTTAGQQPEITFTYGRVSLSLFLRNDPEHGVFLQPAQPAYRYKDETGTMKWSGYLQGRHLMDASLCYEDAYRHIERWKREQLPTA